MRRGAAGRARIMRACVRGLLVTMSMSFSLFLAAHRSCLLKSGMSAELLPTGCHYLLDYEVPPVPTFRWLGGW